MMALIQFYKQMRDLWDISQHDHACGCYHISAHSLELQTGEHFILSTFNHLTNGINVHRFVKSDDGMYILKYKTMLLWSLQSCDI